MLGLASGQIMDESIGDVRFVAESCSAFLGKEFGISR